VRIKGTVLVVVITCMGTALTMAISSQDDTPAGVVGAVTKDHSSAKPSADRYVQSQLDMRFDLSAIKRIAPNKIQASGLFQSKSWYTPPALPPTPPPQVSSLPPSPPLPPSAPQLPFVFIGRMIDGNEITLYLSRNDQQYSARVSDILDGTYRVDKITDKSAVLTYLPLNLQQELVFNSTAIGISALSASVSGTMIQPSTQTQQQIENSR
jgi:hypothetical protein